MKRICCAVFAAAFVCAIGMPALAVGIDDTPGEHLGGYIAQSSALAFSVQPYLPALIATGDVPFEGTVALTTSNVKSGGNAFARGSALWLGSAAGDPGPLIGVGAGQPEIGELFPKWPVQAQANQDAGEVKTGAAPVLTMTAEGEPDRSVGDTRIADVDVPSLVHIEHIASRSTSIVHDSDVANDARVVLHGISLINGHITIDQLRSVSATTSNGSTSTQSGNVVISGLRIGGVDVSVTDAGFQIVGFPPGSEQFPGAGGKRFPGQSPSGVVNTVLKNFHARLTLFRSVGSAAAGNADRLAAGLVLSIDNPVGGQGPIPPGRFDIILGSTASTAQASPPFGVGAPSIGGSLTGGGVSGVVEQPRSVSLGEGPAVGGRTVSNVGNVGRTAALGSSGSPGSTAFQPTDYKFKGVPLGMVIALLLVAAAVSRYIRRFMNTIVAGHSGPSGGNE